MNGEKMEAPEFNTDCESSLESRGEMFGGDKCDPPENERVPKNSVLAL
jgi:hypothetical protein